MVRVLLVSFLSFFFLTTYGQYTRQDSLRGSITPERSWWDLTHYHLTIKADPADSSITGRNIISYKVLAPAAELQIDLQEPLVITRITQYGIELQFRSEGPAHFIKLGKKQLIGAEEKITIHYEGQPQVARRAPWDGGLTWSQDENGKPFVASSCQGIGASIWWPCKDHMYDEPDSMKISIIAPPELMGIANGQLISQETDENGWKRFDWRVVNPINNYGVNLSIGDYVRFGEYYEGEKGPLALDYFVLRDNLDRAREQFTQVSAMLEAFEHWFGPYPFYEDGFKLIEVPYLGMEHQSAITYGNGYQNGYRGRDLSNSGWGLKFDFIIIHEAGHEWFANSITYKDIADMWIHESFTAYSESLFLEYHYGEEAGADYVIGTRQNIQNDKPIISDYDVNKKGSGDMYYKGSNMLHMLRHIVDDDEKWRNLLVGLNQEFYHQTVGSAEVEEYISDFLDLDLSAYFNQYLRSPLIPVFEYVIRNNRMMYRWTNAATGLRIPIDILIDGEEKRINVSTNWNTLSLDSIPNVITIDRNFFVGILPSVY